MISAGWASRSAGCRSAAAHPPTYAPPSCFPRAAAVVVHRVHHDLVALALEHHHDDGLGARDVVRLGVQQQLGQRQHALSAPAPRQDARQDLLAHFLVDRAPRSRRRACHSRTASGCARASPSPASWRLPSSSSVCFAISTSRCSGRCGGSRSSLARRSPSRPGVCCRWSPTPR